MRISQRNALAKAFALIMIVSLSVFSLFMVQAQDDSDQDVIDMIDYYTVINDAQGAPIALVTFIEEPEYGTTAVLVQARGLSPGWHSVSLTNIGQCDAADNFQSAGEVYNPGGAAFPERSGDFIPLYAMQDGTAALSFRTDQIRLSDALDDDGVGTIISESFGDDTAARVGCGAVAEGAAPTDVFFLDETDLQTEADMTEEADVDVEVEVTADVNVTVEGEEEADVDVTLDTDLDVTGDAGDVFTGTPDPLVTPPADMTATPSG
ncbi:MAG: hypothetical protein OHK0046_28540 [Anaerolineae bacterium]